LRFWDRRKAEVRTEKKTIKKGVAKNLPLGFIVSVIQIVNEVDGALHAIYWEG
jgi:hypothetical protein